MASISRDRFESLVRQVLSQLPDEFKARLDNVDIVVDDIASKDQLIGTGIQREIDLLGLYEGIPLTERYGYDMILPDKITIFQNPVESACESQEQIAEEIKITILHEIAHHFGIDDSTLGEIGI